MSDKENSKNPNNKISKNLPSESPIKNEIKTEKMSIIKSPKIIKTPKSQNEKNEEDITQIIKWINEIKDESKRENALNQLSHKRETFKDLALYIWYSTGTIVTLLQEIIYTYQLLSPPSLNIQTSNRICNVLALFQCVAAHKETRNSFLSAQIPIFLFPFLNTVNKSRPFEYLRLTALGVIGALVKVDNSDVINYLLNTEIIPLCLRIMENGSELSKTVATFIVHRILLDENGLKYICSTAERFFAISSVLNHMIINNPSQRLIRHIIRAYARLADFYLVRGILKENIPSIMKDNNFISNLDESSKKWMIKLNKSLNEKNIVNNQIVGNNNINVSQGSNLNMNLMINPVNMQSQQNFIMQQNGSDFNYGMYNDNYMGNNLYMGNSNGNQGYGNINPFYNNYKN